MNRAPNIAPTGCDTSDEAAMQVLHDLVATPSVSGNERAAVERFVNAARALGLDATIDDAGNGVARRGAHAASERSIALLGHIDTVPGDIPVRVKNGVLHGRGSVDAKGPLSAMLVAAARAALPDEVAVHVYAAVGEETPESPGAHFIAGSIKPDACIVGEPSGWDGVTLGYKGCLTVRASSSRSAAHSAGPEGSAPDHLLAWWARVQHWVATLNQPHSQVFEQVQASVTSWEAEGDGLTMRAGLRANFRLPVSLAPSELQEALRALADAEIALEFTGGESAHVSARSDAVVTALSAAIRAEGGTPRHKRKTGTADLNVVAPVWGCPIAAYGPGDSALDHTPDERLDIEEYLRAIHVLTAALESLCAATLHDAR